VATPNLISAAWTGSLAIAISRYNAYTSPDFNTWTSRYLPFGIADEATSIAWDGKKALVIGAWTITDTSSDGITWTETANPGGWASSVAGNGSQFVAVGYTQSGSNWPGKIWATSSNNIAWTQKTIPTENKLTSITWTGSQYVAVGELGTILASPDGDQWTLRTVNIAPRKNIIDSLFFVTKAGNQILALSRSDSMIYASTDGNTWVKRNLGAPYKLSSLIWTGGQIVAVGSVILTSPDGIVWTGRSSGMSLNFITSTDSLIVAVGNSGTILTSPDGITWQAAASGVTNHLRRIIWTGKFLVAVGDSGAILTSQSGLAWSPRFSGTTANLNNIIWTGQKLIACQNAGLLVTSADGITWTQKITDKNSAIRDMMWTGTQVVAIGKNTIFTSSDSMAWTERKFPSSSELLSIAWTGNQLVAVGVNGTILTSQEEFAANRAYNGSSKSYKPFTPQLMIMSTNNKLLKIQLIGYHPMQNISFRIFTLSGRCVQLTQMSAISQKLLLSIRELRSGEYFLQAETNGTVAGSPFIIEK
jgi:hypothetical protein